MNREEVIEVLTNALDGLGTAWIVDEAISAAIKLLAADANVARSPWVKTADRLPTKDDIDSRMNVMAWHIWYGAEIVDYGVILDDPAMYIWWAPMPSLPEVEK